MKTPEEIKKGLECCSISHDYCGTECPYNCYANGSAKLSLLKDALAYIRQLESRLAQVERERDAMSYDMHQLQGALCAYCENLYRPAGSKKVSCKVFGDGYGAEDNSPLICGKFKWRGVCEENMKEEA